MLTRLFFIGWTLLTFPAALPAWELSATQEEICRNVGSFAATAGNIRDLPTPRSKALLVIEKAGYLTPQANTLLTGVIYWVYEHPGLGSAELYVEMVKACRNELAQRHITETKAQIRTDTATICAHMADMGMTIAGKTTELTQAQSLARWREVGPAYKVPAVYYEKLVPFVYQRKRMAPAALRVAVTQQCLNDLAVEFYQQKGWRR